MHILFLSCLNKFFKSYGSLVHFFSIDFFSKQFLVFMCLQYKSFKNTVGKGEIAHYEQFLLFPQAFSICLENFLPFSSNLKLSPANSLIWKSLKFVVWERAMPVYYIIIYFDIVPMYLHWMTVCNIFSYCIL